MLSSGGQTGLEAKGLASVSALTSTSWARSCLGLDNLASKNVLSNAN